jgi:hypothetical protein
MEYSIYDLVKETGPEGPVLYKFLWSYEKDKLVIAISPK